MTEDLSVDAQDIPEEQDVGVTPEEEMLPKATVSKIVARERAKAYEKAKQEFQMQQEQQTEIQPQQQQAPSQAPQGDFGGMARASSPEEIQKMIEEHVPEYLRQQADKYHSDQFVESFVTKMQAAEQHYPGLEDKLNELNWNAGGTRSLAKMVNNLDDSGAIMNELVTNPEKMSSLLGLIREEQPKLAMQRLAALGNSIKMNQEALSQQKSAQEPISQVKSSVNVGVDDHNLTVKDLKKMVRNF